MNWTSSKHAMQKPSREPCPSYESLAAGLMSDPSDGDTSAVLAHLEQCETCRDVAARLTSNDRWSCELQAFQVQTVDLSRDNVGTSPKSMEESVELRRAEPAFQWTEAPIIVSDRFREIEPIGRGGCGRVFRALDAALGRRVALKLPHEWLLADASAKKRFLTELRATAALHHPHIVALHDAGLDDIRAYIVFEYVEGPTLGEWLGDQEPRIDVETAAQIVVCLASGVQHAHEAGIVHRDLKPANVLLDLTRATGTLPFTPRIADFGIARFLNSDVTHTIDETVLGSPPFMSPEQALGDRTRIGPASDVYALGGILYQLLTRQLPIRGNGAADTLRRVLTDEPVAPRRLRPDVPPDLEAICMKCLAKDPRQRYPSAASLALDLQRFLGGESVSARPPTLWEKTVRAARKHPVGAAVTITIATAALVVMVLVSRHSAAVEGLALEVSDKNELLTRSNSELATALSDAKSARDEARESVYAYDMRRAFAAAESGDARMVRSLLSRYADGSELAGYRSIGWQYLWLRANPPRRELLALPEAVYMSTLSSDGRSLAVVGRDANIRIIDFSTAAVQSEWPSEQGEVNGICFSPNGRRVWTAGDDGTVVCWDRESQQRIYVIDAHAPEMAFEVVYDEPRKQIISCGSEGTIKVWDAETGAPRGDFEGHTRTVDTIQLHPDGKQLISQSSDATVRIWNLDSHDCQRVIDMPGPTGVSFVRVSPDGHWLIGGMPQGDLVIVSLADEQPLAQVRMFNVPERICFEATSRRLFVGDQLGSIEELQLEPNENGVSIWAQTRRAWQAHDQRISHLEWSRTTNELISAARDGHVTAWTSPNAEGQLEHRIERRLIYDFAELPGEDGLLVASQEGLFLERLTSAKDELGTASTQVDSSTWHRVAVSSDGTMWATSSVDGKVSLWRRSLMQRYAEIKAFETNINNLQFTPDGRYVCAAARGEVDVVWIDVATGEMSSPPIGIESHQIAFSHNGEIVAASLDRTLRLVESATGNLRFELPGPGLFRWTVAFSRDDRMIAICTERAVQLYDVATGGLIREFLGHKGDVSAFTLSADGRTLVTVSDDRTVQLWHIPTGQNLTSFSIDYSGECRCLFLDEDRWLAFHDGHHRLRVIRIR